MPSHTIGRRPRSVAFAVAVSAAPAAGVVSTASGVPATIYYWPWYHSAVVCSFHDFMVGAPPARDLHAAGAARGRFAGGVQRFGGDGWLADIRSSPGGRGETYRTGRAHRRPGEGRVAAAVLEGLAGSSGGVPLRAQPSGRAAVHALLLRLCRSRTPVEQGLLHPTGAARRLLPPGADELRLRHLHRGHA